jgi:hypothetical protein
MLPCPSSCRPLACCHRNWVALLKGFQTCKTRTAATCTGLCTMMAGKGCTLTPAARRGFLGTLGPRFAACTKLAPAACAANPECKVREVLHLTQLVTAPCCRPVCACAHAM